MAMSGMEANMGNFMKQKWPCIFTFNLDTNKIKYDIFVRKSSYDAVIINFKQKIHWSPKTDAVSASQKLSFLPINISTAPFDPNLIIHCLEDGQQISLTIAMLYFSWF